MAFNAHEIDPIPMGTPKNRALKLIRQGCADAGAGRGFEKETRYNHVGDNWDGEFATIQDLAGWIANGTAVIGRHTIYVYQRPSRGRHGFGERELIDCVLVPVVDG